MAKVDIKLSKAVLDVLNTYPNFSRAGSTLPSILSMLHREGADATTTATPPTQAVFDTAGAALRLYYADGSVGVYDGVQLKGDTRQGSASANQYTFTKPEHYQLYATGDIHADYSYSAAGVPIVTPSAQGSTYNKVQIATEVPLFSPSYDPKLGNIRLFAEGKFTVSPSGEYWGTLTRLDATADKFLTALSMEGSLTVTNSTDPYAFLKFERILSSYREDFFDGSHVYISEAAAHTNIENASDLAVLTATNLAGDDVFNIELPNEIDRYGGLGYAGFESGEGNDRVTLKGGGGKFMFDAGTGNDRITLLGGGQSVSGGAGLDMLVQDGSKSSYTVKGTARVWDPHYDIGGQPPIYPNQFSMTFQDGTVSSLSGVERIVFGDSALALDLAGTAGQAYRLYQAAFNRTLDKEGLGFWIDAMDRGVGLQAVAQGFTQVDEYKKAYGAIQNNRELVTKFYENILHRAPEEGGLNFWTSVLDEHRAPVSEVLAAISESNENKVGLVGVMENGVEYTPYHAA